MNIKTNNAADNIISEGMLKLERMDFIKRFYAKDASLWKTEPEHVKIIDNSLGWQKVYDWTMERLPEISAFADEIKETFTHVVVMGMGGSSLAPEVFRVVFGKQKGYPELVVLDSTNADWVGYVREQIKLETTLFIFASKSGGTVEPSSQFAYFYEELTGKVKDPGQNFIAITDPGTGLEKLATEKKFRKIFVNRSDIGGRFSALSYFGMVPAALAGYDVKAILESAAKYASEFTAETPMKTNPALRLGALMATGSMKMKDKLTLIMTPEVSVFGLWIEQLVAESTGKEGKGVVPVAGEGTYKNFDYKSDRVFVHIAFDSKKEDTADNVTDTLFDTEHPVMEMEMSAKTAIGAQMLIWEIATAAAGAILGVDPFDQPNVQDAKTLAKNILNDLEGGKVDPDTKKDLIVSKRLEGKVALKSLAQDLFSALEGDDFIAILPYVDASPEIEEILSKLRDEIFLRTKRAVVFGFGPRYLHSTGQLHKGGKDNGVYLIISADADKDIKIPGQKYSFEGLCSAQALGDFKALESKGRRAIKIHLASPVVENLKKLSELF
ncbi:glucose-6-phosphate isomerase/transaldolase / glucose-6-phosphate isomerase [Parelusimicrobium proximum]|uniref:glucose-6-phosphate isomerase n=1 Tax=Parelusimicrobium proximum TaxID=3228953 RepID=UPI003D17B400